MALVTAVPKSLRFGPLHLEPAVTLAPMAGVTDTVFRQFIRRLGGCGLIMTEFTSSHGVIADRKRQENGKKRRGRGGFNYLYFEPNEHPIVAQLFGSEPKVLADAARVVEEAGFDGVDMNFGCPVKKVVKCNGGSGLLRDLPLIREILESVRGAVSIPFTCKFRTGWSDSEIVCVEVGKIAEGCGLQGVALHGRTREQGYSGTANWDWIAALKQAVNIPVVGNGDVFSPEDAVRMFEHTGCDGVMIGRAASSNPWIFRQIQQYVATGRYDEPTEEDRYRMIRDYYTLLIEKEDFITGDPCGKMKQFATYFTRGVRNGSQLRKEIYRVNDAQQVLDVVDRFFEEQLAEAAA
jgi:nifR3 family TIM-barrel protein